MRLLLIRHGQTPSNVLGLLDTAVPGPGLTDLGHEQALAIPGALAGVDVQAIYASTQTRAQLTATPLAVDRGIDIVIRDGIREISAGSLEMLSDSESVHSYLSTMGAWLTGDLDASTPGNGESGHEVLARFDEVVAEAADSGVESAVFVSHGAVIRVWATIRSATLTADFGTANSLSNTGIVVLEGSPTDGWTALSWSGEAIGGVELADAAADGPAADPAPAPGR